MSKTRVVIIGGGTAGAGLTKLLSAKLDASRHELTLINPRPFDAWYIALLRPSVTEEGNLQSLETGAFTPYDKLFTKVGTFKEGQVVSIEKTNDESGVVHLASGESVPYDILVLSPGSIWEGPLNLPTTKPEIDAHLAEWRARFKDAKGIVIAGGGAVGVELAGEIKDIYPKKPVTIVQGPDGLFHDAYPAKFRKAMGNSVTARGIDVVYKDYIDEFTADFKAPEGFVTTRNGKKIDADLVVPTRGGKPNTAFLKEGSGIVLNQHGQIPVEATLQVKGHRNIFAMGDAIDLKEQKQAAKYGAHNTVVAANILSLLSKTEPVKKYSSPAEMILVTNGKAGGAAYFDVLWGIVLGDWFARMIKSQSLFVAKHRGDMGY